MTTDVVWLFFFFFNDTATTEIYTLSLHDALPIYGVLAALLDQAVGHVAELREVGEHRRELVRLPGEDADRGRQLVDAGRSEEHTSELQSRQYLVCRLLLEKKKNISIIDVYSQRRA